MRWAKKVGHRLRLARGGRIPTLNDEDQQKMSKPNNPHIVPLPQPEHLEVRPQPNTKHNRANNRHASPVTPTAAVHEANNPRRQGRVRKIGMVNSMSVKLN
jgi:hypothetical protein